MNKSLQKEIYDHAETILQYNGLVRVLRDEEKAKQCHNFATYIQRRTIAADIFDGKDNEYHQDIILRYCDIIVRLFDKEAVRYHDMHESQQESFCKVIVDNAKQIIEIIKTNTNEAISQTM